MITRQSPRVEPGLEYQYFKFRNSSQQLLNACTRKKKVSRKYSARTARQCSVACEVAMHFAALTFFGVDGFLDDPLAGPHPGALDALGASDSGIQTDLANMFPNSAIVIELLANSPILFLVLFLVFLIFVSSFLSRTKTGQTFLHKQALSLEVRRIQPRSNTRGIFTVSSGPCSCTGAGCTWARTSFASCAPASCSSACGAPRSTC